MRWSPECSDSPCPGSAIKRSVAGHGFCPGALLVPALVWPPALRYVHWVWVRIGFILGWINSRIILTILFFVVILPLGILMRALGHDPVARKLDPQAPTYRVPSRTRTRESMERPF